MINRDDDPDLAKHERRAEQNRTELAETVGDLRDKIADTLSPAAVKREVKGYVQESSDRLFETLRNKAYESPLQTVALVGALGYPLWRRVPAVPALMIGAGLALARMGKEPIGSSFLGKPGQGDVLTKAKEHVEGAADNLGSSVSATVESAKSGLDQAVSSVTEAAKQSGSELSGAIDRYPLFVGGIGLVLGALLGAAIPRTSAESELLGDVSDEIQGRARQAMKSGMDVAREGVGEVLREAVHEAERQGLTAEHTASQQTSGRGQRN